MPGKCRPLPSWIKVGVELEASLVRLFQAGPPWRPEVYLRVLGKFFQKSVGRLGRWMRAEADSFFVTELLLLQVVSRSTLNMSPDLQGIQRRFFSLRG